MLRITPLQVFGYEKLIVLAHDGRVFRNPEEKLLFRASDGALFYRKDYHFGMGESGLFKISASEAEEIFNKMRPHNITAPGKAWALTQLKEV